MTLTANEIGPGATPGAEIKDETTAREDIHQSTRPARIPHLAPINIPCRIDPEQFDVLERFVAAGVLAAKPDVLVECIADLRGPDFTSPILETVVRAVDRTHRAGRDVSPATVTETAVEHGLIRDHQQIEFERLLHDLTASGMGEPGCWQRYAVIVASVLRQLAAIRDRAEQVAAIYAPHAGAIDASGRAINVAADLAHAVDAIATQLAAEASRLREHVVRPGVIA